MNRDICQKCQDMLWIDAFHVCPDSACRYHVPVKTTTSFLCHFGFMDNMSEFDEVIADIAMKVKSFPNVGPVPFEIHQSSTSTYYMANDALTYRDLERAFKLWDESEEPDEWVEVIR